jgi:5'-3' exonuclease
LKEFSHKEIVIDANIYLYKFKGDDALQKNIYNMCSILLKYKIKPVFIFDGKPPEEKRELIYQRKLKKKEAEKDYCLLKNQVESTTEKLTDQELIEIENKMEQLKKQFIRLDEQDYKSVKDILTGLGVKYYDADGEADEMCAQMVLSNKAWGCMSDDMDMFVYGCTRIIRMVNMYSHSCILYNMENILKELGMTIEIFREIIVVSGTDYYKNEENSLYNTIKWFYEYQKYINACRIKNENTSINPNPIIPLNFRNWLYKNTKYITDIELINRIYNMFSVGE